MHSDVGAAHNNSLSNHVVTYMYLGTCGLCMRRLLLFDCYVARCLRARWHDAEAFMIAPLLFLYRRPLFMRRTRKNQILFSLFYSTGNTKVHSYM